MSEPPAGPVRFLGVLAGQIGNDFSSYRIGEVVTIEYGGASYQARVTARNVDYDDFGTAVTRYDLEATGAT